MSVSLVDKVKQLLRMCGHAMAITVHERLDAIQQRLSDISEQNTSLARTQTALLQSSLHAIEALQRLQPDQASVRNSKNGLLESCMQRLADMRSEQAAMREQIQAVERQLAEVLAALAEPETLRASLHRILEQESRKRQA